jgi:hypothetical protein
MYYCSEAVKYLPDFEDIISFEDCAGLGMKAPVAFDDANTGECVVLMMILTRSVHRCVSSTHPSLLTRCSFWCHCADVPPICLTDPSQQPRVPGTGANYCESTVKAATNLDDTISTLVKNFGEGSDYFKVLVNVFQSVLLTAEHDHLKNFYMIGTCLLCCIILLCTMCLYH